MRKLLVLGLQISAAAASHHFSLMGGPRGAQFRHSGTDKEMETSCLLFTYTSQSLTITFNIFMRVQN